jgi:hypothetical protein
LRGAEDVAHQAERETQARAQAVEELLGYDFTQLSDIVVKRESDLADKLPPSSQPHSS